MTRDQRVTSITVDLAQNVLLLHWRGGNVADASADAAADWVDHRAVLDVGANGWLLGVEVGERYFPVADALPGTEHLTRSCEATISLMSEGAALIVPRRGTGYELSFPSGNQCWLRSGGETGNGPDRICSTILAPHRFAAGDAGDHRAL